MWHYLISKNLQNKEELFSFLEIKEEIKNKLFFPKHFSCNLPLRLAQKINKNKVLTDPIFRQFVPTLTEKKIKKGFCEEPVKDSLFQKHNLIIKYKNRALLMCSDGCAMHCRFCFRKNFNYQINDSLFCKELTLIREKKELVEIILSGGDPLMMENESLEKLLDNLNEIPHVKKIRFHTRMLTAFPERVDNELLRILTKCSKQIIVVLHVNHFLELDGDVFQAIFKLQSLKNIPFLTQTVLLKGVNDDLKTLKDLFETLSDHGMIPYYLHQLDKVQGAAHFEVSTRKGKNIIARLRGLTSGYNIPSYVREIPREKSKTPII